VERTALDEDKMQVFYHELNWAHFEDCALVCQFYCYDYAQMAQVVSGVSGVEFGIHDILDVGARAQTLSRLFNQREGFTAADDKLPKRVMTAFDSGPIEGNGISDEDFAWFKRRFYERMGWDPETGEPSQECLRELKLDRLLE
jgi:aldehyde:ferredoxin oxidoreductase